MEKQLLSTEETKKLHGRKMIAPIVISAIIVLYYIGFIVLCFIMPIPLIAKLLMGIIPLALAGVIIYVFIERMKEIRSGEEDDLSKY